MTATPPAGALALAAASIDQDEGFPIEADGLAHPYWDRLGRVWTIGAGLTRLGGRPVTAATTPITRAQNDAAVMLELQVTSTLIAAAVRVPLAPCEWAALANFAYNVGGHAFAGSNVLHKLNAGDRTGACQCFLAWDIAGGRVSPGILKRRHRTMALFSGQDVPGVTDRPGAPAPAVRRAPAVTAPARASTARHDIASPVSADADALMAAELAGAPIPGLPNAAAGA